MCIVMKRTTAQYVSLTVGIHSLGRFKDFASASSSILRRFSEGEALAKLRGLELPGAAPCTPESWEISVRGEGAALQIVNE